MESRIAFLKNEASDEGGLYNKASESDFRRFVESHASWSKPNLYLVDNGNLRAVWKNALGLHLGLQFLGEGQVQFVIFATRADATELVRSAGRDSFTGIEKQIASFEFEVGAM
jgi:hypothetical protein